MKTTRFSKPIAIAAAAAMALPLLAGCETIGQTLARQRMEEREDSLVAEENMRRLTSRVQSLEDEVARLQQEVARTRSEAQSAVQVGLGTAEGRISDLERGLRGLDQARQTDKQEVIDALSKKIAQVMQSGSRGATAQRTRKSTGYGYEHEVRPGETLSEIATAYGVSTKAIIEENNLANPNQLRAGQKLFIPE